ncbi:hypothetical protein BV898_11835 [Hypsibius exemplaris]|uniref:BTB domain-containing protein n=1 Tax=Hypsibius exemplaris TaxID=2072580 RepID=A0A1W0WFQ9_HYPEX|nr:hypothetical protein BV898_11835 [Hypsibius exemplaris]
MVTPILTPVQSRIYCLDCSPDCDELQRLCLGAIMALVALPPTKYAKLENNFLRSAIRSPGAEDLKTSSPVFCTILAPAERISTTQTSVQREFLHIVFRSLGDDLFSIGMKNKKPMFTCDTYDGPFLTKWALHFYPDGHPSNYVHPDMEWFPAQYIPDDQKFASLYVRLKEGPHEMVEARMMTTVLNGDSDIDAAITTNMERFMLCPRMKVDEFHKDAAGHGWPKLFATNSLKNFHGGFICVVSLQVLQPGTLTTSGFASRRPMPLYNPNGDPLSEYRSKTHPMINMRSKLHKCDAVPHRCDAVPHSCDAVPHSCDAVLHSCDAVPHSCDAVLQAVDYRWVRAHRFVLVTKSELFRSLILTDQGLPFVYKSTHTLEQLEQLLDLVYLDRLPNRNRKLSKGLVELARFYRLTAVLRALEYDHRRFRRAELTRMPVLPVTDQYDPISLTHG